MTKAIIIGAGLGGLAASCRLAARGVRVTVIERNATVGGKVNFVKANGYSFDTGASLLTMRHVVEDLFAACGRRVEDYLTLEPLEPICRYQWTDGVTFDASTNLEHTENEIARFAPGDVAGFRAYLTNARRKYEVAERTFLAYSLNALPRLLRPRYVRDLAMLSSWQTLDKHNARYFSSSHLRQVFNRYATYNGSSPFETPATFALIPYVEFGLGAWYVRGGMYQLPRALWRLASELGVRFELNAQVTSIVIERGIARGVRFVREPRDEQDSAVSNTTNEIDDRQSYTHRARADFVVANSDAIETYRRLIKPEARRKSFTDEKLNRIEPSSSGFVLLLGVRRKYAQLAHHNIFFSDDYAREFQLMFKELRPADNPTIYVCATSRTDVSQAPKDSENLFVLVNAPATSAHVCWESEKQSYRNLIINKLEAFGLEGLSAAIEVERTITPEDFQTRYCAYRGAIYGVSSNGMMSAFLRPPNAPRDIKNLYFAGGATHPGGGIPLVLLSGKMAAELALTKNG